MLYGPKSASMRISKYRRMAIIDDALDDDDDDDAPELEALVEDSGVREMAINSQRRRNSWDEY